MKEYIWHKQSISPEVVIFDCPAHDPIKDFRRDPTGAYVLIRLLDNVIEVAICSKDHVITHVFRGRTSQELYHAIFKYEKQHGFKWFGNKEHIAYLGKELKKCELAILEQKPYLQE